MAFQRPNEPHKLNKLSSFLDSPIPRVFPLGKKLEFPVYFSFLGNSLSVAMQGVRNEYFFPIMFTSTPLYKTEKVPLGEPGPKGLLLKGIVYVSQSG